MRSGILLVAFMIIGFMSCDNEVTPTKVVIDKIVYERAVTNTGLYHFSDNGQIVRYEYFSGGKLSEYVEYVYAEDRLVSKNYFQEALSHMTLVKGYKFTYDVAGMVDEIAYEAFGGEKYSYSIEWNNDRITSVDYRYSSRWMPEQGNLYEIEYDNRGNAIEVRNYVINDLEQPELRELDFIAAYEYDDKINPLFELDDPYDFVVNFVCHLCNGKINAIGPNNVVKATRRSGPEAEPFETITSDYNYDESDLPLDRMVLTHFNGVTSGSLERFFYRMM